MAYYNPQIHHRRSIRLKEYDYSREGLYFITLCVKERFHLFGKIINGQMALNEYGRNRKYRMVENTGNATQYPVRRIYRDAGSFSWDRNNWRGFRRGDSGGAILGGAIHESPQPNESPQRKNDRPNNAGKWFYPKLSGGLNMVSSKQINLLRNTPGVPVWQRDYYEHIIRDERGIFKYIQLYN